MECWNCGQVAKGICAFCGRAICKDCSQRNPLILAAYDEAGDHPHLIVVDNALWCGKCKLVNQTITIPELEGKEGKLPTLKNE